jgi:hypothetical protein
VASAAGRLWLSAEGRPQPFIDRHGDPVTPREDTPDTAYWFTLLIDYIEGRPPPASARQPRVTPKLRMYAATHGRAAREFAAARAQEAARAAPSQPVPVVLEPAQTPPVSAVEEITTAQAQNLTGLSAERWRQLARASRIRFRRTHHRVLLLNRADVIAYDGGDRRRRGGTRSGEEPGPAPGDPGGAARGSAAGGGRAA